VARWPGIAAFKPIGRRLRDLAEIRLGADELEALRLADLEGLYHEAAAERMGVSRVTFGRVVARARAIVAEALVDGKVLIIGGGPAVASGEDAEGCPVHWGGRRRGRGCRCGRESYAGVPEGRAKKHGELGFSPESPD
jgi:predicted DNA-binding protein (UPF0251 family)